MTVVLGISLVVLGLALWVAAGLLPVLRLQRRGRGPTDATLDLTWMGVVKLRRRPISGITGARLGRDSAQVELATRDGWVPLALPKAKPQLTPAQLTTIVDHYAKESAPPRVLALPLRDRLSTMVTFAILFPLGTMCIFAGTLLAIKA